MKTPAILWRIKNWWCRWNMKSYNRYSYWHDKHSCASTDVQSSCLSSGSDATGGCRHLPKEAKKIQPSIKCDSISTSCRQFAQRETAMTLFSRTCCQGEACKVSTYLMWWVFSDIPIVLPYIFYPSSSFQRGLSPAKYQIWPWCLPRTGSSPREKARCHYLQRCAAKEKPLKWVPVSCESVACFLNFIPNFSSTWRNLMRLRLMKRLSRAILVFCEHRNM